MSMRLAARDFPLEGSNCESETLKADSAQAQMSMTGQLAPDAALGSTAHV